MVYIFFQVYAGKQEGGSEKALGNRVVKDCPKIFWVTDIICFFKIIKPGVRGRRPCAPGFLKLLWFARWYVCVCVCVCVCVYVCVYLCVRLRGH